MRRAWVGAAETLERSGILALGDAEADRLRERLAVATRALAAALGWLADIGDAIAADTPAAERHADAMRAAAVRAADVAGACEAEQLEARRFAAARWTGFEAWAADTYGADPWAMLAAAAVDHVTRLREAGDVRELAEPATVAAVYRSTRERIRAMIAAAPPGADAVEAERLAIEASAAHNGAGE